VGCAAAGGSRSYREPQLGACEFFPVIKESRTSLGDDRQSRRHSGRLTSEQPDERKDDCGQHQ
jgi:hypothetical protein